MSSYCASSRSTASVWRGEFLLCFKQVTGFRVEGEFLLRFMQVNGFRVEG